MGRVKGGVASHCCPSDRDCERCATETALKDEQAKFFLWLVRANWPALLCVLIVILEIATS